MVKSSATYQGQLRCTIKHEPSGTMIETDAPVDNMGRGEKFSPTDLIGAALLSCIITTMAIVAERDGIPLLGTGGSIEKEMSTNPRRIEQLRVRIHLPKSIPEDYRQKLERIAYTCPVHRSLLSEINIPIDFFYG